MTMTKTFSGAAFAVLLASSAQAATFDFTFFAGIEDERPTRPVPVGPGGGDELPTLVAEEEREVIGSGVLIYAGPAVEGEFEFADLNEMALDITIGQWSWDEDDIMMSPITVGWQVADQGGFLGGSFFSEEFVDERGGSSGLPAEPVCGLIGSILLFNGEQCLTASPSAGFPDEFAIYAADSMFEGVGVAVQAEPEFGTYEAIARVGTPPAPVPLPATLPLLALALGGMGYARSRRS